MLVHYSGGAIPFGAQGGSAPTFHYRELELPINMHASRQE